MSCNFYADLRNKLFIKAQYSHDIFLEWSMDDRFNYLMSNSKIVRHTAKACHLVLQRRELQTFPGKHGTFVQRLCSVGPTSKTLCRFDIRPALYRYCPHVLCLLVLWPVRTACIRLNRVWFYVCSITVLPLWSVYPYVVSVLTRAVFRASFPYGDVERGSHTYQVCVWSLSLCRYVGTRAYGLYIGLCPASARHWVGVGSMLGRVIDGWPALIWHRFGVSCLLGSLHNFTWFLTIIIQCYAFFRIVRTDWPQWMYYCTVFNINELWVTLQSILLDLTWLTWLLLWIYDSKNTNRQFISLSATYGHWWLYNGFTCDVEARNVAAVLLQ